jgi:hypothetical protein
MTLIPTPVRSQRLFFLVTLAALAASPAAVVAQKVIPLTHVGCQFLESEGGVDHGFQPAGTKDCRKINARTGKSRLQAVEPLSLPAGRYVFRVTNARVPYAVGFWIRGATIRGRLSLPDVSDQGIAIGETRSYEVDLPAGRYLVSCPYAPTLTYRLDVRP